MSNKNAPQWTERKVQVAQLVPYETNPRVISEAAYGRLKASIQEMGYHQRIIVQPDLRVIGGHQRIRALQELGIMEVAVLVPDRVLSQKEFSRLLIQDNVPFGEFDWPKLQTDFAFQDLKDWGLPLEWLAKAKPPFDDAKAEETPALQAKVISRPGDLWLLGSHRLLCGDSTAQAEVERLLGGAKPNLMVTDPPYGVEYDPNWRNETGIAEDGSLQRIKTGRVRKVIGAKALGRVENDDRADWLAAWELFQGNIAYVWHAGTRAVEVGDSLILAGFAIRSQIIWDKGRMIIGRGDYHWAHEPLYYAVRKTGNWCGDRKQTTIWHIEHRASETGHSTQKPIECMRRPIINNSAEGDAVYDPFMGSGTTIIAAEQTGRIAYGMEISPAYCDLIVRRWMQFTGKQAILGGTDQPFFLVDKLRNEP